MYKHMPKEYKEEDKMSSFLHMMSATGVVINSSSSSNYYEGCVLFCFCTTWEHGCMLEYAAFSEFCVIQKKGVIISGCAVVDGLCNKIAIVAESDWNMLTMEEPASKYMGSNPPSSSVEISDWKF